MTDYYISNLTGNDANTGLSPAQAWLTFENLNALFDTTSINPGDNIYIEASSTPYDVDNTDAASKHESTIRPQNLTGGSFSNMVTFTKYGSGDYIRFDCQSNGGKAVYIFAGQGVADYCLFEYFEIFNADDANSFSGDLDVEGWIVQNCYIHSSTTNFGGIKFGAGASYCIIQDNQIENLAGEGLYLGEAGAAAATPMTSFVVRRNTIDTVEGEAIEIKADNENFVVYDNTITNGGGYGAPQILAGGTGHIIFNNTIVGASGSVGATQGVKLDHWNEPLRQGAEDIILQGNLIKNAGSDNGILLAGKNNYVINNTVIGNAQSIEFQYSTESSISPAHVKHYIYNNAFVSPSTNHVLVPTAYSDNTKYSVDYNAYDSSASGVWKWDNTNRDFTYVQGTLGYETNRVVAADLEFVDTTDYDPANGSPLIDAGDSTYTTVLWYGDAPNIGWSQLVYGVADCITIAIANDAADTGGGNQDFTTADLGGLTPKAAIFIIDSTTVDGTPAAEALFGVGCATTNGNQWAITCMSQDNVGTSVTKHRAMTDQCICILDPATTGIDGEASFVSFITNGVRVNWGDAPSAAFLVTVILFAGTNLNAYAGTFTSNAVLDGVTDVMAVGWEPDALILGAVTDTFTDSTTNHTRHSYGAAVNDGSDTQRCFIGNFRNNVGTTEAGNRLSESYGIGGANNAGAMDWGGLIGDFDAVGFSCTSKESGSARGVGYLALNFNSEVNFWLDTVATPVAIGKNSQIGPNFQPQFVLQGLTQVQAINTTYQDADAGTVGLGAFTETAEWAVSMQDQDNVATTNTQSESASLAVEIEDDDGTTGLAAAFVSMDSKGWSLNYTAVHAAARQFWALAIEACNADYSGSAIAYPSFDIISPPFYEIWLTTDTGNRIALLDNIISLDASRVVNGIGNFSLELPPSFDVDLVRPDADRMVQIWRQPSGGRLGLWRTYFLLKRRQAKSGSRGILEIGGPDVNHLLFRRIVAAFAGSSQAKKSDYADDMMKEIVTQSIADGVDPTPDAGTRVWSNLSIASDLSLGPIVSDSFPFKKLLTLSNQGALPIIAKASKEAGTEVFFDIVPDVVSGSSITFIFRTYTGQRGADVSASVVFSEEKSNLLDPSLEEDYTEAENYIYATGQGEEDTRIVKQVYDATRYNKSIWGRTEGEADSRNEADPDAVELKGQSVLNDGRPRIRFTANPLDTQGTRFGIDWNFGDKVQSKHLNYQFYSFINAVSISLDGEFNEKIGARLDYEGAI